MQKNWIREPIVVLWKIIEKNWISLKSYRVNRLWYNNDIEIFNLFKAFGFETIIFGFPKVDMVCTLMKNQNFFFSIFFFNHHWIANSIKIMILESWLVFTTLFQRSLILFEFNLKITKKNRILRTFSIKSMIYRVIIKKLTNCEV